MRLQQHEPALQVRGDFDAFGHAVKVRRRTSQPNERLSQIADRPIDTVVGEEQPATDSVAVLGECH